MCALATSLSILAKAHKTTVSIIAKGFYWDMSTASEVSLIFYTQLHSMFDKGTPLIEPMT